MKNPKFWQVSEVQISYKTQLQAADRPKVASSRDAENILRENWSDDIELLEEFVVLFLTKANQVKGLFRASKGGTSGTVVSTTILPSTCAAMSLSVPSCAANGTVTITISPCAAASALLAPVAP